MADGEIRINTKIDESGLDKGLKDIDGKLKNSSKSFESANKGSKSFGENLKSIGAKGAALAGGVGLAVGALKKTVDVLNDCAAAYRVQENAEKALEVAARNNPYLNGESVDRLKAFASELQNMSEVGDEVSIQVMAQLGAAGRTEEEIQKIMSAAVDMSAATGQDLASAAQTLNMTFNGMSGTLGRQIDGIKNLTAEELKAGAAVDLVAQKYKGMAKETADVEVQLSNAWGDFKENIGKGWQEALEPAKKELTGLLSQINAVNAELNKTKNKNIEALGTTEEKINIATDKLAYYNDMLANANDYDAQSLIFAKQQVEVWGKELGLLKSLAEQENKRNKRLSEEQKRQELLKAQQDRNKQAADYIKENEQALQSQIEKLRISAIATGENIDAQDVYNAYLQSYIDLITKSNGLVTENNAAAKERLALIKEQAQALKDAQTAEEKKAAAEKLAREGESYASEVAQGSGGYFEEYKRRNAALEAYAEELHEKEIRGELDATDKMLEIDKAYAQNKKDLWANITTEINSYTQQAAQVAQDMGELMLKDVETRTDLELAELDAKYEKGEISEEEYYEKQKQIQQKAAQDEYKIRMFEWTTSILTATANIAEGVSKAIAQGGTAGLITGALVGAAGAVQIGSIIASKPTPPHFANSGFIGGLTGATYGSDTMLANVRQGEYIMNVPQQKRLLELLNGNQPQRNDGSNIYVNNTQSNRVDADVRQNNDGIFIDILDKHINKGLADGDFDAGFASMNTRQQGERIL